jgi:hypothetical protein
LAVARAAAPGASWVRFDETVLYLDPRRCAGLVLEQRSAPDRVQDLYLVTQVGRVFQREHRDVPVPLDKGRYLVVVMHAEQARRAQPRQEVCYGLRPCRPTVVLRTVTPTARAPEAHVQDLVE